MRFLQVEARPHATLRHARPITASVGLTPARFDLLFAVYDATYRCIRQSDLRRVLGVAPVTVSRMLRSLLDLDYARRRRDPFDRRTYLVTLTVRGLAAVRRIVRRVINRRVVQRLYEGAYEGARFQLRLRVDALHTELQRIARHLGDRAHLGYPLEHPDD